MYFFFFLNFDGSEESLETLELFENGEWKGSRELPSLPTIESTDALWPPPPSLPLTENYTPRIISPGEADI